MSHLNTEQAITDLITPSGEEPITTARGKVISPSKMAQLEAARNSKKRKREEDMRRQVIMQEDLEKTKQELNTMKGMLEKIHSEPNSKHRSDDSSSEESEEDEEELIYPHKRSRLNQSDRASPIYEENYNRGYGSSWWGKFGAVMLLLAANTAAAMFSRPNETSVRDSKNQPAINKHSVIYD